MELHSQRLLSLDIGMADYPNKAPSVKFLDGSRPRALKSIYTITAKSVFWVPEWVPGGKPTSRHYCKVLVSIQAILVRIIFNEPGFEKGRANGFY
jgi:hypothetical protein